MASVFAFSCFLEVTKRLSYYFHSCVFSQLFPAVLHNEILSPILCPSACLKSDPLFLPLRASVNPSLPSNNEKLTHSFCLRAPLPQSQGSDASHQ